MDVRQAARVQYVACVRKRNYTLEGSIDAARQINATLPEGARRVRRYRCPFCGRYHVGRLITPRQMRRLALAIRVIAQGVPIGGTRRR